MGKDDIFELCASGGRELILEALGKGAAVDERDSEGKTPLMFAGRNNRDPDAIRALLDAGAAVNDRSKDGVTALMFAASRNDSPEALSALLGARA